MKPATTNESLALVEKHFRAGELLQAQEICLNLLQSDPQLAEGHRFLGLIAYLQKKYPEAQEHLSRALAIAPADGPANDNMGLVLIELGDYRGAEASARRALEAMPGMANPAHNLGIALLKQNRFSEAETILQQAMIAEPLNPNIVSNLAIALEKTGKYTEAVSAYQRVFRLRPRDVEVQSQLRRLIAIAGQYDSRTGEQPELQSLFLEGIQRFASKQMDQAEKLFRWVLALDPDHPQASYHLGKILLLKKEYPEAQRVLRRAVRSRPDWAEPHYHLGLLYQSQRLLTEAEIAYRRALELDPTFTQIYNNLGAGVLNTEGRILEAREIYQQGLRINPDDPLTLSNWIFNEQYVPGVTLARLAEIHGQWAKLHGDPLRKTWKQHINLNDPEKPLRIGFLSGDLFLHPVGLFLDPVLTCLDQSSFTTNLYANQDTNDEQTKKLAALADHWNWVTDRSDEEIAEQIRADQIDILIDLSGHTGRNRLLVMARKPAPVQMTWAGYVGTTGLDAIDYLIADRVHVPVGVENNYKEKLLRLPYGYICYQPPGYAPKIGPLPAYETGHITFGSLNNTAKINRLVISTWAEILRKVPTSRLLLKTHWLDDYPLRRRIHQLFEDHGVAADRIELIGITPHLEQLACYNRIDIGLDPFPYSGGLTTLEASWMGVPVITCPGETFNSRHSLSHLTHLGFTDTVVGNLAEYVDLAVQLARDLGRVDQMRFLLRPLMQRAPLCNPTLFTDTFSQGLRQAWRLWCQGRQSTL